MHRIVPTAALGLMLLLLVSLGGCIQAKRAASTASNVVLTPTEHEDLLIGYTLLSNTLKDESKLWALRWLKKVTFRLTARETNDIMDRISSSASQRKKELSKLRKLAPNVAGAPEKMSAIGDAITAAAKDAGTGEMLDQSTAFNLRFMLVQAQATRMVSAMAVAIAKQDCNAERQEWLKDVSVEYEAYREEIIHVIQKYVRGQGAEQVNPSWLFTNFWHKTERQK